MYVQAVSFAGINSASSLSLKKSSNHSDSASVAHEGCKLNNTPVSVVLAQMPNVSFGAKHYNYGKDDFTPYDEYDGPTPPQIEMEKYRRSIQIQKDIDDENYLAAIRGKIELARICRSQGKEDDAYMLENSIRELYKDLPRYQREDAKSIISQYNHDMAKYIDKDTGVQ